MAFLALEMEVSWPRERSGHNQRVIVVLYGLSVSPPRPKRACRNAWLSLLAPYISRTRARRPARSKSASFAFTSLQIGAFSIFLPRSVAMLVLQYRTIMGGWCHGVMGCAISSKALGVGDSG